MQTILCLGRYFGHDVMYFLAKRGAAPFVVEVLQRGHVDPLSWTLSLGVGIDAMVRWCNLPYPGVLDMVQQAIRRMHMEEILCGGSPRPVTDSCADTGACGL